ncbi:hypothetical protein D3C87_1877830 [compost metagenome]
MLLLYPLKAAYAGRSVIVVRKLQVLEEFTFKLRGRIKINILAKLLKYLAA